MKAHYEYIISQADAKPKAEVDSKSDKKETTGSFMNGKRVFSTMSPSQNKNIQLA